MRKIVILFLRALLVFIGIAAFAFLLWEPHIEGRNANATLFAIYFNDPFLAYAYIASLPFFIGLYQALGLLGYARQNKESSASALQSVRNIKRCAFALIGLVALGEVFILLGDSDDRAGGVFMGILIILGSIMLAVAMVVLERFLRKKRARS